MAQPDAGLGQQALNKVAEMGLSSQLDAVENLEVDIQTDPLKMVQGQVDKVQVEGEGLVMQEDLRMESLKMEMKDVAINPFSAAFGKIELTRPTQATAEVVLNEADLNRAFNSNFVGEMLQNLPIQVNGQTLTINLEQINFRLPAPEQVQLSAVAKVKESAESHVISFSAVPKVGAGGQKISLENIQYQDGKELSPELTQALLDKTSEILDLRNFELEGMDFTIRQLQIQNHKLLILADAQVEQIPTE